MSGDSISTFDALTPTFDSSAAAISLSPGAGALSLDGQLPGEIYSLPSPNAGLLAVQGYAPTVTHGTTNALIPGSRALSLNGQSPVISVTSGYVAIAPQTGALSLDGQLPGEIYSLPSPSSGALALQGSAPFVLTNAITPATGSLALNGQAISQSVSAQPFGAAISLQGYAPKALIGQPFVPGTGTLAFSGLAPSAIKAGLYPVAGSLGLAGAAPQLALTINVGAGAIGIQGQIPRQIVVSYTIAGTLSLQGYAPTVAQAFTITPAAGNSSFLGNAPAGSVDLTGTPNAARVALAGSAPQVGLRNVIAGGVIGLQGSAPLLKAAIFPATGTIAIGGQKPQLALNEQPKTGALSLAGQKPVMGIQLYVGTASVGMQGYAPKVYRGQRILPSTGSVGISVADRVAFDSLLAFDALTTFDAISRGGPAPPTLTIGYVVKVPAGRLLTSGQAPGIVSNGGSLTQPAAFLLAAPFQSRVMVPEFVRRVIRAQYQSHIIRQVTIMAPSPYAEFYARLGDQNVYGIDWTAWLQNQWQSAQIYAANAAIRPTQSTGYQYLCTQAGETGSQEPKWPSVIGETISDGSVVWTCAALDTTSLTATLSSATWTAPSGIGLTGQTISGQVSKVKIDATGATVGTDYLITNTATMSDGTVKVGEIKLKVRT